MEDSERKSPSDGLDLFHWLILSLSDVSDDRSGLLEPLNCAGSVDFLADDLDLLFRLPQTSLVLSHPLVSRTRWPSLN